ncbi:carbohydrate kinase family protein [Ruegeria sp. HKCCA5014]|uniref:carbohydrate kinase family protein n=1 Tax=Ruegeria sp. HKCCA5014 TaxID=2682980 RepID=UPI00148878AB|nr:carbohydrate kinase family protein [Ruegeria sp. HKCCA5014]
MQELHRSGLVAAGNFIVDHVKIVDEYPNQDQLALVQSQSQFNGGGPYNLLRDLVALGAEFPLHAEGLLGNDSDGDWIIDDCKRHGIDTSGLRISADLGTSWTDVMSVQSTGRRTFFHYPGANNEFDLKISDVLGFDSKIFYLGYLTMLEALDAFDADGRTQASRILECASDARITTVADLVSRKHPQFGEIIASSAPHLDYLILNEIEASWLTGRGVDETSTGLPEMQRAAQEILKLGVRRAVVLHSEFGAVCAGHDGLNYSQTAVCLPHSMVQSKLGAGDAFAAGFLMGLHGEHHLQESLEYAVSAAAACITSPSASDGIRPLPECLDLAAKYGFYAP